MFVKAASNPRVQAGDGEAEEPDGDQGEQAGWGAGASARSARRRVGGSV